MVVARKGKDVMSVKSNITVKGKLQLHTHG